MRILRSALSAIMALNLSLIAFSTLLGEPVLSMAKGLFWPMN